MSNQSEDCPRTIGPWIPERLIGSGAVAAVYLCTDDRGRTAAVKWLNHGNGPLVGRFRREIESLRRLDHPGVTRFIDSGEADGRPFLAMEHVAGTDLRLYASKLHKRPSAERYARCRSIGRSLADALAHIHGIGLVHRDVKPSNVLISDEGRVVLGDFGVVKDPESLEKTAMGIVVGTLAYAAPEQILSDTVDVRTDIFGLGATLYYVLTLKRPFGGFDRDLDALPTPPSRVDPAIPADLEGAVMRMLAAEASHRPRDAASVRALLSSDQEGGTVLAGTRSVVKLVAECLEVASEGNSVFARPTGPAGTRKAWVGDLLRNGAQRRGIAAIEVLERGAWAAVRARLDAGETLLLISPHELEVPESVRRIEIPMAPLSLADVRRSLVSMAPRTAEPAMVATTLHEWTGGLPRLLAALLENHVVDEVFVAPAVDAPNRHVERFFEGLDMDEVEVLGTIALASAPMDVSSLETITQVPVDELIQGLVDKGLVVDMEGRFRLMGTLFKAASVRALVDPEGLQERIDDHIREMGREPSDGGDSIWVLEEIRNGIEKAENALLSGGLSAGLNAIRRAVDISGAVLNRGIKAEANIALANVLIRVGLLDEAARRLADATAFAHAEGRDDLRRLCHGLRAWVSLDQNPRSRAAAASAVDRILPMLDGSDARSYRPEDALLYAIWARASAVLGDRNTHQRAAEKAFEWAKHVDTPLALGIRLQVARGMMVCRDREGARDAIRIVMSERDRYPLLGWEAARLLAILDGGLVPPPGNLTRGLDASVAEALENRPV